MLRLVNIKKEYKLQEHRIHALKGIDLSFRENEFVAVLGPSGCGKTTLLNIVGGLDQYTSGDLIINGRSTKDYKDRDWDTYRNHSIGFVFQNYHLIPHQTVLANVELALTISGISREERRRRAIEALEKVGLGDQLKKRPNQVSGGQSQRVAIARALVTNPDIILADEPTGALDSETSVQIMDILKEISGEKLVIMVTHNPELAEKYATRTVTMKDGLLTSDSDPYTADKAKAPRKAKSGRAKMNYLTAFSLSLKNLMTKKGRTALTAFAGSIGIIGIALIFALSNGIQVYVDKIQEDTLTVYPITIEKEAVDTTQLFTNLMRGGRPAGTGEDEAEPAPPTEELVYSRDVLYRMMSSVTNLESTSNNLPPFRDFLENNADLQGHISSIRYSYDINPPIYTTDPDGNIFKADILELMDDYMDDNPMQQGMTQRFSPLGQVEHFEEMLAGENGEMISPMLAEQYDLIRGSWPQAFDEVVLVMSSRNEISDMALYTLGLKDPAEIDAMMTQLAEGETISQGEAQSWTFDEVLAKEYKLVLPSESYSYNSETELWSDLSATEAGVDFLYNAEEVGIPLKITGIIRENPEATAHMLQGAIGYTTALTEQIITRNIASEIIQEQKTADDVDVFNGLPFRTEATVDPTPAEKAEDFSVYAAEQTPVRKAIYYTWIQGVPADAELARLVDERMGEYTREEIETQVVGQYAAEMGVEEATVQEYIAGMDDETLFGFVREASAERIKAEFRAGAEQRLATVDEATRASLYDQQEFTEEQLAKLYDQFMPPTHSDSSLSENLALLGDVSLESPEAIYIYSTSFRDKDAISDAIAGYNDAAVEGDKIAYTDYVALLMSSITAIISGISYLLIAFVAISLVVSSIMIGIITYISVLERTQEIGILRAMGASKRDISNVFSAETVIEGLAAGLLGVGIAGLLTIPINNIVHRLTEIENLNAVLPLEVGAILVGISVILTLIAGILPSRMAAKKDPVEALRTE
ncbi:MAG: ABC transporter ATP-binding protein/permease [Clostridia bacterium]|nr:ABC transporter ATP-binding protein/permease [Clostridia bacterium]